MSRSFDSEDFAIDSGATQTPVEAATDSVPDVAAPGAFYRPKHIFCEGCGGNVIQIGDYLICTECDLRTGCCD